MPAELKNDLSNACQTVMSQLYGSECPHMLGYDDECKRLGSLVTKCVEYGKLLSRNNPPDWPM